MDLPFSTSGRWLLNSTIVAFFIGMFMFVVSKSLSELPPFGYPIMRVASTYLREGFIQTGAANMVSAIVLDYRALDTLCEATALFTAVMGVLAIVRRIGKKKSFQAAGESDE
jgi:multisubunit Na+/H+ antiporter MnhB subunit